MIVSKWADFRYTFVDDVGAIGPDGVPVWDHGKVRAFGFDSGLTGIPRPITAFPLTVSCNGQVVDGGAAFDWYLSQRTDTPSLQWLSMTQFDATRSGTVVVSLTSKCVTDLGLGSTTATLSEENLVEILRHVDLYVCRKSDFAIQWVPLLRYTLSAYS